MGQNIFQIWEAIDKKIPFAVRRDHWQEKFYIVIENVECDKMPYGKAYGYPTIDGEYSTFYDSDSKWKKEKIIPSSGVYGWALAENPDLTRYQAGFRATEKTIKGAFTILSRFYMGKFKGRTVDSVFMESPSYIDWAIINMGNFFLTKAAFEYLDVLKPNFRFTKGTKDINDEKFALRENGKLV
jgi:hypothetical protein